METLALGIDIGGTNTVFGYLTPDGHLTNRTVLPTLAREGGERLMGRIAEQALAMLGAAPVPVAAIGVGSAGQIDPVTGTCLFANANLPGWTGMQIRARLEQATGLPVTVGNDANVAALAEQRFGAGRGVENLVCITLGTGVGGGIISEGRIMTGHRGVAGEMGHIVVEAGGAPCPCGMQGCLEAYASATAIVRRARAALPHDPASVLNHVEPLTAKVIFAAAGGAVPDPLAERIVAETAWYLALGLASILNMVAPELILIGGGVSLAGEPFVDRVRAHLETWAMTRGRVRLALCSLGDDAGVIGAAAQVLPAPTLVCGGTDR
ncbi:MAG: glucokinase [Symbiobacteriaceae bacterium]|jgi:glucokinase|nr:glucokinase [Symbiobacteriaceae bacterium]